MSEHRGRTGRKRTAPVTETDPYADRVLTDADRALTDEERTRARKKALALLTDMDRTEAQLTEKLQKAGFSDAAVSDAMDYVRSFGYIDDTRYARHYIEVVRERRSLLRIREDLRKKGVPKDILENAMEDAADWDEKPLIRRLAEKKARALDLEDTKDRQKLVAALARRGFRMSDIYHVLDEMRDEE